MKNKTVILDKIKNRAGFTHSLRSVQALFTLKNEGRGSNGFTPIQSGFTVVELLIYMALLSVFLIVLTELFSSSINIQLESQKTSSIEQDGRYILLRLIYDIQRSTAIVTPSTLGAQGATLQLTIGATTYTYSLNGTDLQINDGVFVTQLNSVNTAITSISFTRLGNPGGKNSIRINYDIDGKTILNGASQIKTYTTTVTKR